MKKFAIGLLLLLSAACSQTADLAIKGSVEAERIQDAVNTRLDTGLRIYMYKDLVHNIENWLGRSLTDDEAEHLNKIWNECGILTFWQVQNERAKALRMMTIDAKIYADQNIFTLLGTQMKYGLSKTKDVYNAVVNTTQPSEND